MSLKSADPHDSDVMREKNRILGKFVKNALFVVCDVAIFYQYDFMCLDGYISHNIYFLW